MTFSEPTRSILAATLIAALSIGAPGAIGVARADSGRSAADVESARQLYQEGVELRTKGDAKGALEKFKSAHALGRTPITGLELARSLLSVGQPVEAREVCLDIARIPVTREETGRSAQARKDADALAEEARTKIAKVTVRISGVSPGRSAKVTLDDVELSAAAVGVPRATNPGTHRVSARVDDGPIAETTLALAAGESKEVSLAVLEPAVAKPVVAPPPVGATSEPPPVSEPSKMSPLVPIGAGVLAVGAIVGTVFGAQALSKNADLDKECTLANGRCPQGAQQTIDDGKAAGNLSTVGFVVAGVGAGILIYGLVAPKRTKTARAPAIEPFVGLAGGGFHGRF